MALNPVGGLPNLPVAAPPALNLPPNLQNNIQPPQLQGAVNPNPGVPGGLQAPPPPPGVGQHLDLKSN